MKERSAFLQLLPVEMPRNADGRILGRLTQRTLVAPGRGQGLVAPALGSEACP